MALSDASALFRGLDPVLWVVTAAAERRAGGLLATFVNAASIVEESPRVVVGIAKAHRTWELIETSGAFALHLLSGDPWSLDLASRFGLESGRDADKFAGLSSHFGHTGSPILDDALGWLDCRVEARFDTGDRTLYLGAVVDARARAGAAALTVKAWVAGLDGDQRTRMDDQYRRDAATDADAIRAWRAARTGN